MMINLDDFVRKIPDFPHKGILFYDITGILSSPIAFNHVLNTMHQKYRDGGFTSVACVESRGFIFGAPLANSLNLPLVLVRKAGKLPGETFRESYSLEYGKAEIEVQKSDINPNDKVLLIDDLLATGGTLEAAIKIFKNAGAFVTDVFSVIGLPFLNYNEKLRGVNITTLIEYDNETL
jgi:adenine phosphoribosyltransferase